MDSPSNILENALEASKKAVQFDEQGEPNIAAYYYEAASRLLSQAAVLADAENQVSLNTKAAQYKKRANELRNKNDEEHSADKPRNEKTTKIKQFHFLLQQAIEEDEQGEKEDAIELYAKAIEYVSANQELMQGELKKVALQALERAEELKGFMQHQVYLKMLKSAINPTYSNDVQHDILRLNLLFEGLNRLGFSDSEYNDFPGIKRDEPIPSPSRVTSQEPTQDKHQAQKSIEQNQKQKQRSLHRGSSAHLQVSGQDTYTEEEKLVLLITSKINKVDYLPFMSVDLSERFQYSIPFTDKNGHLILSPKQKRDFYKFVRIEELCTDPCIVYGTVPNYLSIKQTVISDCSFVASLAVSAFYEKRFGRKLVTATIYPQSKDKKPLYNPFGKYMIKLHVNGISRKVIIDDYLPVDRFGRLLCSYSSNKNEFWISLLEKAYMKVMGGYDFPGSNSNIDLHALTGWIPERKAIRVKDPDFNKDTLFSTLESRMAKGDVLVTVATGELSDYDAERSGLVPTHAYAVMEVLAVNEVRLLKLKNPWSHLRWRGNYSELDTKHWTPELKSLLNYDPNSAAQFDNGVFWIDYDSVCSFFDVFYLNWNPELFKYTYCIHQSWNAGTGPVKDLYTIGSNPQFSLNVASEGSGSVWLLLTRHITDIDDFRENKEYITLFVYKNGQKVYYPFEPPPYIDGVKINSPHYLCKIILGPGSSRTYTIVVSQYEKSTTIHYTLRAYSTCPFTLTKITDPYKHEKQVTGEWKGITAGGCPNHPATYSNNPKLKVEVESPSNCNQLLIELKGPKQYQIGLEVIMQKIQDETTTAPFKSKMSGPYRSGYVALELNNIPNGVLKIIPSTFLPGQEGPFILVLKSSASFTISNY